MLSRSNPNLRVAGLIAISVIIASALVKDVAAQIEIRPTTLVVTTTDDELDSDGNCSLREAIRAANLDLAVDACPAGQGADTIILGAGTYTLSLSGTGEDAAASGDLDLTGTLNISGAGAATTFIDGGSLDRVFEVLPKAIVEISNLTIQHGMPSESDSGAGVFNNAGILLLVASSVSGNTTRVGAGIDNSGILFVNNSTIDGNSAFDQGGGIHNTGSLTILNSTISANTGGRGGGIANIGTLIMANSTLSLNNAERGGAILNTGLTSLVNSTISTNTAGRGGGVDNVGALIVTSSTIYNNSASQAGGVFSLEGNSSVQNSIIAGNTAADAQTSDCAGSLSSLGYNLIQQVGTCQILGDNTGNVTNLNPDLGPLQFNGGATPTHALLPGSPAIDAGSPQLTSDGRLGCPPIDQRNILRPQDGNGDGLAACDIGAYELVTPSPPTLAPITTPLNSIYLALMKQG